MTVKELKNLLVDLDDNLNIIMFAEDDYRTLGFKFKIVPYHGVGCEKDTLGFKPFKDSVNMTIRIVADENYDNTEYYAKLTKRKK